ncbi:MAG: putative oxidoreductase [halophilic archaeon J07HX64]|jgi:Predicted oxidoreductases (related to aryl-alcohol dehydrogenases)|nr:MAG: putative oxidoreductase [halophilic archaeon J07HX64]
MNRSDTFTIGDSTTIHRLGYGAMRVTGPGVIGPPADESAARALLRHAVDLGVDFIDTADSYGPGVSERLIGEALDPADALVATKAGLLRNTDGDWLPHGDPDYIRNQALVSRDRLGVERIDLYQLHTPGSETPLEESVQALAECKDDGLIEHIGLSNVTVEQLERARDQVEVATVQNRYNVTYRDDEDVLQACEEYDIGFMPWYPLAAGDLGGPVEAVADAHGVSPHQVALAWLLEHSEVMLPIPGTSSVEHLEDNLAASQLELTDAEYTRLANLS